MHPVCLVTGGARGIGRATALLLAEAGSEVGVGFRTGEEQADAVVDHIRASGGHAVTVRGDVASDSDVVRMFDQIERELGPVTALVNSAGIDHHGRVEDLDPTDLSQLMAVNVVGLMLCCREAVRRMSSRRGGRGGAIVNVSSMASTIGGRPGASAYAASKGAVDVFTVGLAKEVAAEGVRVNAVRPGVIRTDMVEHLEQDSSWRAAVEESIPMRRLGNPEEVAEAIAWLLSKEASWVTGTCLDVSGGGYVVGPPTG